MTDPIALLSTGLWPPLAQTAGSFWLPPQESTIAPVVDQVFYLILSICSFFFLLVVGLMMLFVVRYRRREGVTPPESRSHNTLLELAWTFIPLCIVGVIFYQGFVAYMDMRTAPPACYEIRVTAGQWWWLFQYPNGAKDENLHVPVDEPVRLVMTSTDVIHSLSIPAFRIKMDLVPGRYTDTWFRAVRPGTFDLYCTEYCGDQHSDMLAAVVVHPPGEFEEWLKGAADFLKDLPPAEAGEILFARRGCAQCHSVDGKAGTGPTLKGIFGDTHDLAGGRTVVVDDNYIRESLLEPQAKVRSGYNPVMSTYKGILSDDDVTNLIEYIKTLE